MTGKGIVRMVEDTERSRRAVADGARTGQDTRAVLAAFPRPQATEPSLRGARQDKGHSCATTTPLFSSWCAVIGPLLTPPTASGAASRRVEALAGACHRSLEGEEEAG